MTYEYIFVVAKIAILQMKAAILLVILKTLKSVCFLIKKWDFIQIRPIVGKVRMTGWTAKAVR